MLSRRLALAALLLALILRSANFYTSMSPASKFRLPALPGVTLEVTQGNNQGDHIAANGSEFAFDFKVGLTNFVETAAQGGTVIGFNDSSNIQCSGFNTESVPDIKPLMHCWAYANFVLIADDDGQTAALYVHLLPYSNQTNMPKVSCGEHVNQGDPIGLAGTTGYSFGVHLHFQVESLPSSISTSYCQQSDPTTGWWWTNSLPVSFSNSEVHVQDNNGVPQDGQSFLVSKPPSPILPGGVWANPSPKDGQVVTDIIDFAAHAYPTHAGDPAIAKVNFTVGVQGVWKVACTVVPPATGDLFACEVNLKSLGIPYGQIQVSFDVYDQAGNVNLAPNGEHTLTYMPTPQPVPTPTPLVLQVTPTNLTVLVSGVSQSPCKPNESSYECIITLTSPASNQKNINWSVSANNYCVWFYTLSNGTLAPGQQINVPVDFTCTDPGTSGTITFTGAANPVTVQWTITV